MVSFFMTKDLYDTYFFEEYMEKRGAAGCAPRLGDARRMPAGRFVPSIPPSLHRILDFLKGQYYIKLVNRLTVNRLTPASAREGSK